MQFLPIEQLQPLTRAAAQARDASAVRERLEELFEFYEIINFDFHYTWPFWRGRICDSASGYELLSEIHHPPPACTRAGRLNEAGCPLLYASVNKFTAFTEIGADSGFVHLVGYVLPEQVKLRCAMIGETFNVHRSGRAITSEELGAELRRILNETDYRAARSVVFLDAFFASLLADPDAQCNDYIHSRTLANLIFAKMPNLDAIYYPSVALESGMNIAIKPGAAEDKLRFAGNTVVEILERYDFGIYDFVVRRNSDGHYENGFISWKSES